MRRQVSGLVLLSLVATAGCRSARPPEPPSGSPQRAVDSLSIVAGTRVDSLARVRGFYAFDQPRIRSIAVWRDSLYGCDRDGALWVAREIPPQWGKPPYAPYGRWLVWRRLYAAGATR